MDRAWIIAEIGVNHEGDEAVAADLIRKAASAGADAVKFQTFLIENYISKEQPERYERTKGFQLSRDAFCRLAKVAEEVGVFFFSTPLHMSDVDFLDEIAPIFKISSGDLTYHELIRHIAGKGKPTLLSTGLGTEEEVAGAIDAFLSVRPEAATDGSLIVLHCVASYPTEPANANLRNMHWLHNRFGLPVGFSDHTLGIKACELAAAMGAVVLEKHFTYRIENQAFHDHALSADPKTLTNLIASVRQAETYLGVESRLLGDEELKGKKHMRRSIGAAVDIPQGTPVKKEWLTYLRPQWGLKPEEIDKVIGQPLNRHVAAGDIIKSEDLVSLP